MGYVVDGDGWTPPPPELVAAAGWRGASPSLLVVVDYPLRSGQFTRAASISPRTNVIQHSIAGQKGLNSAKTKQMAVWSENVGAQSKTVVTSRGVATKFERGGHRREVRHVREPVRGLGGPSTQG